MNAQVVIVPIIKKDADRDAVMAAVAVLAAAGKAAGIRVKVDGGDRQTPGWKFNYWEMKGVPVRVEVGPKDVESGTCVVARRDRPGAEKGLGQGIPYCASRVSAPRKFGRAETINDCLFSFSGLPCLLECHPCSEKLVKYSADFRCSCDE